MSEENKARDNRGTEQDAAPAAATEELSAQAEESGAPVEPEVDPTEALKAENADLRDKLLRVIAEMENLRKRTEREVRDAQQYAISNFARDVLGVGDNMRRALDSVGEDTRKQADAAMNALLDGVEMTERELLNVLDRHGIKRVEPQGERFDPHLHQAMFEVQDESVLAGTIVQVMQSGYTISGRVLRPAMVGVSKGGPKPGAEAAVGGSAAGGTVDRTA